MSLPNSSVKCLLISSSRLISSDALESLIYTGYPNVSIILAIVDFPLPMPPVKPIFSMGLFFLFDKILDGFRGEYQVFYVTGRALDLDFQGCRVVLDLVVIHVERETGVGNYFIAA